MSALHHTDAGDVVEPAAAAAEPAAFPSWFRDRHGWIAALIYTAAILLYDHYAVEHLGSVCGCSLGSDPTQWMWSWVWIPHAIGHGLNPFFTNEIWYPGPFNLAAVTMAPVLAIPGAPLDALFGPIAAYNLLAFTAPVISGWSAYRLCRYLSGAPWASILAGYTYGFSAYQFAHQLAHMNLIWAFAPPLMALILARHMSGDLSRRRAGIGLSFLFLIEFGISTEVFFTMVALAGVAAVVGFALATPEWRRRIVSAVIVLVIGCVVTGVIWSYYIYESFQGPAASKGFPVFFPSDVLSYVFPNDMFRLGANRFSSLAAKFVGSDITEQNSYLGLPLILIFFAYAATLWRRRLTKVVVTVTAVAFIFSLGDQLTIAGNQSFEMPYGWIEKLPLFDLLTPSRLGLYVALGAAIAAAVWLGAARGLLSRGRRWFVALAALAFLVPNLGLSGNFGVAQVHYSHAADFGVPTFFTTNLYKRYLHRGEVALPLPYAFSEDGESLLWQADTHLYFKLASGYFGPSTPPYYPANPLFYPLVAPSVASGLPADASTDYRALVTSLHVSVALVADSVSATYRKMLAGAGWRLEVNAGGIQVWRPARP